MVIAPTPARGRKKDRRRKTEAQSGGNADPDLFQRLRALRKQLADQGGVPPYVIFHDATLREMAQRRPSSLDEFALLPGVGQAKLARYAEAFLSVLKAG
jgi:ATP-dependent DNA helicase RecQ